jgi:hypothetical protein
MPDLLPQYDSPTVNVNVSEVEPNLNDKIMKLEILVDELKMQLDFIKEYGF